MSQKNIFNIDCRFSWLFGHDTSRLDESRLLDLLERIRRTGSIASAAREIDVSYRNAWGLLTQWEDRFGHPLLISARGLGTQLTPFAAKLLELDAKIRSGLTPHLAAAAGEMKRGLSEVATPEPSVIRLHASHDLVLAKLPEFTALQAHPIELKFLGSLESLASFAEGRCEMAGFHCPEGPIGASLWQQYRSYLKPRQHALIRLARRMQGMMVKAGNPKKLRSIRDLARPGIRFLNRQRGAGTRLLLDWLLQENGIAAQEIAGYGNAELTHSAVAAMIASGHADVGLGVEAAAHEFKLGFVPLLKEDYFLVTRRSLLQQPTVHALVALLGSREFRRAAAGLPGYDVSGSGTQASIADFNG